MTKVILESPYKTCPKYNKEKEPEYFSRDKSRPDGRTCYCKECVCHYKASRGKTTGQIAKEREYQKAYGKSDKRKRQLAIYGYSDAGKLSKYRNKLKTKYGLTPEQLNSMVDNQGNRCLVCDKYFANNKSRHVDHCHKTGKVRGLLCNHCNRALGAVYDDIKILKSLIKYLENI